MTVGKLRDASTADRMEEAACQQITTAKTWKLEELAQQSYPTCKVDAWVYYCGLCDEVLLISRQFVEVKGVQAAFDGVCPDCGLGLEDVINYERTQLPHTRAAYINPKHPKAAILLDFAPRTFKPITLRNACLPTEEHILTTGIDELDKLVRLTTGQLVVFHSSPFSRSLPELFCVRAQLDHPIGLNSDAVFIDGGNSFDAYAVSNYAIERGIEPQLALSRIHISRAFTYFQLVSLLAEKLPNALGRYHSKFAIVSEITDLFQDPEVKDEREAHHIFRRVLRSLSSIAKITDSLVIVTNSRQDIEPFDAALMQAAHATILAEDGGAFTQFALTHHKSLPPRKILHREDRSDGFLEDYLEG